LGTIYGEHGGLAGKGRSTNRVKPTNAKEKRGVRGITMKPQ